MGLAETVFRLFSRAGRIVVAKATAVSVESAPTFQIASPAKAQHALQLLDALGDGVFCLDTEWRFTFVNAMAERVLQRKRDELIGASIWDAFPAVVVPSSANTGFSVASPSSVVPGRIPSSSVTVTSLSSICSSLPFGGGGVHIVVIGTISSPNTPLSLALAARR